MKLLFIASEFRGQLPRPFDPLPNGTWALPPHMNDLNKEEPTRYVKYPSWSVYLIFMHMFQHILCRQSWKSAITWLIWKRVRLPSENRNTVKWRRNGRLFSKSISSTALGKKKKKLNFEIKDTWKLDGITSFRVLPVFFLQIAPTSESILHPVV